MLRYYTVEYDGYTYKKKEEAEAKERLAGEEYFLEYLNVTPKHKKEISAIIDKINTRSKWKDLSDKQERIYSKMEKILGKLRSYTPFSQPFLTKVSKREAPEYYNTIKHPMDLSKIGKKISMQEYSELGEFAADLELIWSNCFQFNNTRGNIYAMYAQKMKEKASVLMQDLYAEREIKIEGDQEEIDHFLATEKIRKESVATRSAILQNPQEFICRRTPAEMESYWRKEVKAIEDNLLLKNISSNITSVSPGDSRLYFPEYKYFYNSFPVCKESILNSIPVNDSKSLDILLSPTVLNEVNKDNLISEPQEEGITNSVIDQNNQYLNLSRKEVYLLFQKLVAHYLIKIGFSSADSSALSVISSYVLYEIDILIDRVADVYNRNSIDVDGKPSCAVEKVIKSVTDKYKIVSTEIETDVFFSEEEEDPEEESILDLICSDVEEMDQLDDII